MTRPSGLKMFYVEWHDRLDWKCLCWMTRLSGCLMFRLPPLSLLFQMLAFAPAPLQKQSESLGHLCQKCAFAPTLFKCKMNHLVIFVKSMPLPPPCSNAEQITWSSLSKACLCPHPVQMQNESMGHLCQKHAFAPTLFKCRTNHLVIFVKSMPLPPLCSNAERITWSSLSKACLCPHPSPNAERITWSSLSKACLCPYPAEMQSESLGHICQKRAFAPTLFKCRVSHLFISVKSLPLPPPLSKCRESCQHKCHTPEGHQFSRSSLKGPS